MPTPENNLPYADNLDASTVSQIEKVFNNQTEIDHLWQEYGESLGHAATGASLVEMAKRSFKRRLPEIRQSICSDPKIQKFLEDPRIATSIEIALIVTGKLLEDKLGGVNVCALGVLIARLGLLNLCQNENIKEIE